MNREVEREAEKCENLVRKVDALLQDVSDSRSAIATLRSVQRVFKDQVFSLSVKEGQESLYIFMVFAKTKQTVAGTKVYFVSTKIQQCFWISAAKFLDALPLITCITKMLEATEDFTDFVARTLKKEKP